jgi:hypothetical protein
MPPESVVVVSAAVLIVVLRMCTSDGMHGGYPGTMRDRRGALRGSAGQPAGCLGLRLTQLRAFGQEPRAPCFKEYHSFQKYIASFLLPACGEEQARGVSHRRPASYPGVTGKERAMVPTGLIIIAVVFMVPVSGI